ncbi:carbohydrate kinase family protein [Paludisphaera mucosa]|uniref:Carbohydrate kinase family protein n=1 Tax=Paludisphaera mucosa TaxID=3030827 RepID=A0ABT6FJP2_9BACT|nr:carbohydrate kinase family protein [Paludisphaera mucosa]MDG3007724.1 carbohydrate kinase family protein [Paludisphaera mucosa]
MPSPNGSKPPVVCAGIVVADHLCTPIERLPAAGELMTADDLVLNIGGCASNAAMDLARLGVRSAICGKVGDDAFGRFVAETLVAHGVDVRTLGVDRGRATSQTLVVNVRGEDRRYIHCFGANRGFTAEDLDDALADPPRVLYLGGYLVLPGLDPEAVAERFARARRRGTTTVLDVVTPGPGDHLAHLRSILPETDVFLPNADEAALILGESDPLRQAMAFRELGARRVVVTRGEHGAIAVSDALRARLGAYPVPCLDGSGGGDAFDAGYIAGLLDGLDELGCLRLASAVGASCVRSVGTTAGVFTRHQADAFIALHDLPVEDV